MGTNVFENRLLSYVVVDQLSIATQPGRSSRSPIFSRGFFGRVGGHIRKEAGRYGRMILLPDGMQAFFVDFLYERLESLQEDLQLLGVFEQAFV